MAEGEIVFLVPVDGDDMDDDERAGLHESLQESIRQMKQGQPIDADKTLAELRACR